MIFTGNPELEGISNLCVFASNYDDPYLKNSRYIKVKKRFFMHIMH